MCMCSQGEKIIYEHFIDPEFVGQLIEFLSLEDRKGKDSFSPRRFCLFKVHTVSDTHTHTHTRSVCALQPCMFLCVPDRGCSATMAMRSCPCCGPTWSSWLGTLTKASRGVCVRSQLASSGAVNTGTTARYTHTHAHAHAHTHTTH